MARLRTIGYEVHGSSGSHTTLDGANTMPGNSAWTTTGARTGKCLYLDSSASNLAAYTETLNTHSSSETYYYRWYFKFENFPTTTNAGIMTLIATTTQLVSVRLTSSGTLILWNDQTSSQLVAGSVSVTTGVWYRVELLAKVSTVGDDTFELRVDGASVASITGPIITSLLPNRVRLGWPVNGAAGVNIRLYVDDGAINDATGSYENSWPGPGNVVLLKPVSDNSNTSWTTGNGGTTLLFDAVNATPPVGVASASQTATSNIECAVKTANSYRAAMTNYAQTQYGHDGLFIGSGSYNFGVTAGNTESAYYMIAPENFQVNGLTVALHKTGSPTDNVVVSIKSDSSNTPSTTLASGSVAGTSLTTSPAEYTITLSSNVSFTAGTKYWIHFSRSGATSLSNFYAASISNGDYTIPTYLSAFYTNSGLSWSSQTNYTCCLRWSFVNGTGNNIIKVSHAFVDHAEDIATGTKTGTFSQISNPAEGSNDTIAAFGNDAGAAGTWPTNWFADWGAPVYYPSITTGTRPVMEVTKTDTSTRTALVDFMGIYVEYVDVNDGPTVTFDNTTFPDQNYYLGPFVA